jgi:hypothetical protein
MKNAKLIRDESIGVTYTHDAVQAAKDSYLAEYRYIATHGSYEEERKVFCYSVNDFQRLLDRWNSMDHERWQYKKSDWNKL